MRTLPRTKFKYKTMHAVMITCDAAIIGTTSEGETMLKKSIADSKTIHLTEPSP
jgi:hypothetical protein